MNTLANIFLLGVRVTKASESEVLEFIIKGLKKNGQKMFIVTLNPEIIVFANKNKWFQKIINDATLGLADGIGVIWAGKILGKKIAEKITGVALMEKLCKRAVKEGLTVGFLGGRGNLAEKTAECLREKYSKLKIGFIGGEWSKEGFVRNKTHDSKFMIHNSIDILFVAFGFPKQEIWISENLPKIPVKMAMGVGGAFDYISGRIPRAPKWAQEIGLEWLFRLIRQPWRIKRQLALFTFIYLVFKERFAFSQKNQS